MHPGFSVIFLTTLIGAGQGLFFGLYAAEVAGALRVVALPQGTSFFVLGSVLSLAFTGLGAIASLFHLGHPERAWRAMAMWRTSWLSREGIAMLSFMATVFLYGLGHLLGWRSTLALGAVAAVLSLSLFVCTGMIYACIKFLQEWASPLTVINYTVLGCASGFTLASAFAAFTAGPLVAAYATAAIAFTLLGLATRSAALVRNGRIKRKSSLQSATGIHHPRIVQKSQGFMGGSYNTREFFHGRSRGFLRSIKWVFLVLAFALPLLLLGVSLQHASAFVLCVAFVVQYTGLIAERWFFFAQSSHPQNLYYQTIS
ncbi:dimethyl sulfoxide reductase anchor subunit family protein [Methylibium sp.]|uniref:dimethyl sulfoxide reductase anchor subunit family protein n=1 Tax=Methylibium sp. TaxID=2067992 RepID=UPI003D11686F